MPIINKKNFMPIVCCIYTALVLGKITLEAIWGIKDNYYSLNLFSMFFIVIASIFVLSLHYFLQSIPLPIVMIGQYLVILFLIMAMVWMEDYFSEVHPNAYRDMFLSFTIPFIVLSGAYYIKFYIQLKKANEILNKIKSKGGNNNESNKE